jgi:hypothetical protein
MTGAIVDRIKIAWNRTGFVTAEVDYVSIFPVTDLTAYSGTLTADTVSASVPDHSMLKVYIDDTTIGTTQDTAVLDAEVEWRSFMAADENAKRLGIARRSEWTAKLTRFHEAADLLAASRTKGLKRIRVGSIGPALGTTTWELGADLYGLVDSRSIPTVGGFVGEEVSILPKYNATAGTDIAFRLTNSVAVL